MARPTLLVAELEPGSALSTRKLVLETGKFNVLTAHSSREAAELFSAGKSLISAAIVTSEVKGASSLIAQIRKQKQDLPVILLSPNRDADVKGADHHLSSHEPQELLQLCREILGDPRTLDGKI